MASLFLVLSLCAFVVQRPPSVGMHVPLIKVRAVPCKDCDFLSDRSLVVRIHNDGNIWINETQVNYEKLGPLLTKIYENRAEKLIYIVSDPDVPYGEFANIYSRVVSSDSDLHIVLVTSQIQAQVEQCPFGSCCVLEWPDHTKVPTVLFLIPSFVNKPLNEPR